MADAKKPEPEDDFTDEEIAEQLKPFFAEVDADYDSAFDAVADEFRKKGPLKKACRKKAANPAEPDLRAGVPSL